MVDFCSEGCYWECEHRPPPFFDTAATRAVRAVNLYGVPVDDRLRDPDGTLRDGESTPSKAKVWAAIHNGEPSDERPFSVYETSDDLLRAAVQKMRGRVNDRVRGLLYG